MSVPARHRRPHGSVLIEFVIVLPVFLLLLLASIDWGWYFVLRETAVNATREGARVGSVAPGGLAADDAALAVQTYLTNSLVLGTSMPRPSSDAHDGERSPGHLGEPRQLPGRLHHGLHPDPGPDHPNGHHRYATRIPP